MTPMAALVFTATFALMIWIPTFALTARVYPPNEGKDLQKPKEISTRVMFCCYWGCHLGRRVAQRCDGRLFYLFRHLSHQRKGII